MKEKTKRITIDNIQERLIELNINYLESYYDFKSSCLGKFCISLSNDNSVKHNKEFLQQKEEFLSVLNKESVKEAIEKNIFESKKRAATLAVALFLEEIKITFGE